MRKFGPFFIILFLILTFMQSATMITDGEFIERNEEPKQLGYNLLEIYNYKGKPLIFFDGYHQTGAIYLGDFKEIENLYNFKKLDFILVDRNSGGQDLNNFYFLQETDAIELQDEDNSISIINNNTIVVELKRFKFIVSKELNITDELQKVDAQFFILDRVDEIEIIQESFSLEKIFLISNEHESDNSPLISLVTDNHFVQFICDTSSYRYEIKTY